MKERPILFNGAMVRAMVRAILDGRKTQTRRVAPVSRLDIKPYNGGVTWGVNFSKPIKGVLGSYSGGRFTEEEARRVIASQFCPCGQPGDRLWVREAFDFLPAGGSDEPQACEIVYWATGSTEPRLAPSNYNPMIYGHEKVRPSIHMPRWASRITLEITGVRIERLCGISDADAKAEGAPWAACGSPQDGSHKAGYAQLWESINGPGSWDANPWVWVVEFRRIKP